MKPIITRSGIFAAAVAGALSLAPAQAQESPTPGRSTEAFQDWSVECTKVVQQAKAEDGEQKTDDAAAKQPEEKRVCEAVQVYRNNKTGNEIARIAFAYAKGADDKEAALKAGLRVIVDVSFKSQPKLLDGETTLMEGAFTRCTGNYCYAEFTIGKNGTKPLAEAKKAALQFPISSGRVISIGVSPKGLTDALKVLEGRNK